MGTSKTLGSERARTRGQVRKSIWMISPRPSLTMSRDSKFSLSRVQGLRRICLITRHQCRMTSLLTEQRASQWGVSVQGRWHLAFKTHPLNLHNPPTLIKRSLILWMRQNSNRAETWQTKSVLLKSTLRQATTHTASAAKIQEPIRFEWHKSYKGSNYPCLLHHNLHTYSSIQIKNQGVLGFWGFGV